MTDLHLQIPSFLRDSESTQNIELLVSLAKNVFVLILIYIIIQNITRM